MGENWLPSIVNKNMGSLSNYYCKYNVFNNQILQKKRFYFERLLTWKPIQYKAFKVKSCSILLYASLFSYILIIIRKYQVGNAWIGLHDTGKEKEFRWFNGNFRGGYKKWCPNQPDDYHNKEDCVELSAKSHCLNDVNCSISKPFICEINDVKSNVSYFSH